MNVSTLIQIFLGLMLEPINCKSSLSSAHLSQYYPWCMLQIAQSLSQLWIRQGRMPTLSAQPKLQATKQPQSLSRRILLDYTDSARTNSG